MEHSFVEELEKRVQEFVRHPGYRPMKPRRMAKFLELNDQQTDALKRVIKKLAKRGELRFGPKHLILGSGSAKVASNGDASSASAANDSNSSTPDRTPGARVAGVFRRTAAGAGYVRPSGTSRDAGKEADIRVAPEDAGDASSGDLVLVRLLTGRGRSAQPRGVIEHVVERERRQFVGTYFEQGGQALTLVDGTVFNRPIVVGDPGAKNARPNDKVVFEMVRFPSHIHDGEGVLVEVLGPRGQPGVDTLSIIREFNLPEEFPPEVQDEARSEAARFDESIGSDRRDLTADTVITIDPADARDFDDAVSVTKIEGGHWLLAVHIADVSHFVRPGSTLDREAYRRATSVYLPDRVIPMLPELISNGLASLQPDRTRYTKTALIEFAADGSPVHAELKSTAIKSKRRFTYEEIDDYLKKPAAWKDRLTPEVHALVGRMHDLAMILRKRRFRRGALELDLREVKVDLDADGRVSGAHRVENTVSHQIIEEFMLAANEAVANRLAEAELHFLRRVHPAPSLEKLKALTEFVTGLGFQVESLESRFELQRLLAEAQKRPEQHAVNYAVLRSFRQATYGPEREGHYALASECYCHFTSPIRRYPDLIVHRLVDGLLTGRRPRNDFAEMAAMGEHCSGRERQAEEAERELTKVKLLNYLSERIGMELEAVVTGVEEYGIFVQGKELPAEGRVHISAMADDYYTFDRRGHSLTGRKSGNAFRLGDSLRVTVARVDVERRELDFRIVDRRPRGTISSKSKTDRPSRDKPTAPASPVIENSVPAVREEATRAPAMDATKSPAPSVPSKANAGAKPASSAASPAERSVPKSERSVPKSEPSAAKSAHGSSKSPRSEPKSPGSESKSHSRPKPAKESSKPRSKSGGKSRPKARAESRSIGHAAKASKSASNSKGKRVTGKPAKSVGKKFAKSQGKPSRPTSGKSGRVKPAKNRGGKKSR